MIPHGNSWLMTIIHDWNQISESFTTVSQELRQRGLGSRNYKLAVNEAISKL
jgi:hypothetical protein